MFPAQVGSYPPEAAPMAVEAPEAAPVVEAVDEWSMIGSMRNTLIAAYQVLSDCYSGFPPRVFNASRPFAFAKELNDFFNYENPGVRANAAIRIARLFKCDVDPIRRNLGEAEKWYRVAIQIAEWMGSSSLLSLARTAQTERAALQGHFEIVDEDDLKVGEEGDDSLAAKVCSSVSSAYQRCTQTTEIHGWREVFEFTRRVSLYLDDQSPPKSRADAAILIGDFYVNGGFAVSANHESALEWFGRAFEIAEAGRLPELAGRALFLKGCVYKKMNARLTALSCFENAALKGNSFGAYAAAKLYLQDALDPKGAIKAFGWLFLAASKRHEQAAERLDCEIEFLKQNPAELAKTIAWYSAVKTHVLPIEQILKTLSALQVDDDDVKEEDLDQTIDSLVFAAQKGNAEAAFQLAHLYKNTDYDPDNGDLKAFGWLFVADHLGHAQARIQLNIAADFYRNDQEALKDLTDWYFRDDETVVDTNILLEDNLYPLRELINSFYD